MCEKRVGYYVAARDHYAHAKMFYSDLNACHPNTHLNRIKCKQRACEIFIWTLQWEQIIWNDEIICMLTQLMHYSCQYRLGSRRVRAWKQHGVQLGCICIIGYLHKIQMLLLLLHKVGN